MIIGFDGHLGVNVKNYLNMFLSLSVCFQDDALANSYFWWELPPHIIVYESLFSYFELWATAQSIS